VRHPSADSDFTQRDRLDAVISNAAVVADLRDHTAEGIQRTLATNHLAPYLLLRTLGESLAAAGRSARLVVVGASPVALRRVPVRLDDLEFADEHPRGVPPSFRPFVAYGRTKNMNAMFVYSLAKRLAGTGVTVNGAHPGIIRNTGLGRDSSKGLLRVFGWTQ
jgi:NAD(P)-dependent dehydrogenase (short-subunit alcohol dehydrogenase family)